jgi:hypothetical protein
MEVTYTRWMCDYCAEVFDSRADYLKHKGTCTYNPEKRRCLTCGKAKVDSIRTDPSTTALRFTCTQNHLGLEKGKTEGLQVPCQHWVPKGYTRATSPKTGIRGNDLDIRCGDTVGINLRALLRYMEDKKLPLEIKGYIMHVSMSTNCLETLVSEDAVIPLCRLAYGGKVKLVEE